MESSAISVEGKEDFQSSSVGKRELFSVLALGGGAVLFPESPLGQAHVGHENDWAVGAAQLVRPTSAVASPLIIYQLTSRRD